MSAFNIWRDDPPPRDVIVMAKYALTAIPRGEWAAKWQLVRTCKRGCCVRSFPDDSFGTMLLPKFWREPTAAELHATVRHYGD